ncbi:MAG: LamG domain-containing protein [Planctomycetes bacterium]|nr:LamG domain-containing protein [Planctomycetota bacterium]
MTSSTNSLDLSVLNLQLDEAYYWRVDEVNEAEVPSVWAGPVWSLNTIAALVVDDFESYGNVSPDRPFQAWLDGFGYSADEFFPVEYPGNGTGAGIGHDIWSLSSPHYDGDIMETSNTIAGSGQSMPFYYTNTGGVASQTERTFTVAQDWTVGDVKTLSLPFFGASGNTGQLYVKINGTKVPYDMAAEDIALAAWQAWNIDLASLGINLQNITEFVIGVDGSGASGMVLIDDITLHAQAGELITPVDPGTASLVSTYHLDGDFSDSTGNRNAVPMGTPQFISDPTRGQVLSLDGASSAADVPHSAALNPDAFTASLWANADPIGTGHRSPLTSRDDGPQRGYIIYAEPGNTWQFWIGTGTGWSSVAGPAVAMGEWTHLTVSYANEVSRLYVNGFLAGEQINPIGLNTAQPLRIGGGASEGPGNYFFVGMIDEVRIYNAEVTAGEALWLSGRDAPIHKPF